MQNHFKPNGMIEKEMCIPHFPNIPTHNYTKPLMIKGGLKSEPIFDSGCMWRFANGGWKLVPNKMVNGVGCK